MSAPLCLQNRTGGSPLLSGGFFNQHYRDFCMGGDTFAIVSVWGLLPKTASTCSFKLI